MIDVIRCTATLSLNYYVPNVVNLQAITGAQATPTATTAPTGDMLDPRRRGLA